MEPNTVEDKAGGEQSKTTKSNSPTYKNTAEYITALEKWLQEAYMWQCVSAWFPYMLMSHQLSGSPMTFGARGDNPFGSFDPTNGVFSFIPNGVPTSSPTSRDSSNLAFHTAGTNNVRRQDGIGVLYKIPPLWKRFVAEFLDFLLLFSAKLFITFIAIDFLDVIVGMDVSNVRVRNMNYGYHSIITDLFFNRDLDKYDLDHLQQNDEFDYKMAMDMLSEILLLELVHNVVACIFEAVCIYKGSAGRPGGATPGKSVMGLRVVMSDHIVSVTYPATQQHGLREGNYVRVHPGGDLGFWWAMCRSFVKNFVLAFFSPVCLTMFFSNHNRTAYDNISHSLVVEEIPRHQN